MTIVLVLGSLAWAPAGADEGYRTGDRPCGVLCAHYLRLLNTDYDGCDECEIYFEPCQAPFPEGSYADHVVIAPEDGVLEIEYTPAGDSDLFLCEYKDENDTDGIHYETLARGGNVIGENCDNVFGPNNPIPFGCRETINIAVKPGARYIVRIYNVADANPLLP